MELRMVKDRSMRAEFDAIMKDLDEQNAVSNAELKKAKSQQSKAELFGDSAAAVNIYSTEGKTNEELLEGANRIQDMTFASLARTRNMIEASKEVGTATVEELRRQKEQIKDIEAEVDVIDSNLQRAEKLIVNFTRRMATDKIIQGFAAVNVAIMIALILYVAISGKSLSASSTKKSSYSGPSTLTQPSSLPTSQPTSIYFGKPSRRPTAFPTNWPTSIPTQLPIRWPTGQPTRQPTRQPTGQPTRQPSRRPTSQPTREPTQQPSRQPTGRPTGIPSSQPSREPTQTPTSRPTARPTSKPAGQQQ
jgi:hypothetical protein